MGMTVKLPGAPRNGELRPGQIRLYCKFCDKYCTRTFDGTGVYICNKCNHELIGRKEIKKENELSDLI